MPVGSVDVLSESDDEEPVIPEPPRAAQVKKRKLGGGSEKESDKQPVDAQTALRAILGTPCRRKRRQCMSAFQNEQFQPLLEYRKSFASMHKLDQDHLVSRSVSCWLGMFVVFLP